MNTEKISSFPTPIQKLGNLQNNFVYVKREDFIPFSFGGNKARKAKFFFREILNGKYTDVVTYGSSSSNHCRIISNLAVSYGIPCYIISPEEASEPTFNSYMMECFGADIVVVPTESVSSKIEEILNSLRVKGRNPYFIAGGGHGNLGTEAYVECYNEICDFEKTYGESFDYIFHASGTGTTQAGLICGKIINKDNKRIIGISIARKKERGRKVVLDSVREYLISKNTDINETVLEEETVFEDSYIGEGYGFLNSASVIEKMLIEYGMPLDGTYTGKAFMGMLDYLASNNIKGKKILFIHTGGTPLFFDFLKK